MNKTLQPNDKFKRIAQRVIDNIGNQYMTQLMEKDGRIRSLHQQHAKAMAEQKFFKARIIDAQLLNRTQDLQFEEAGRRIHAMCENGEIDDYLDEDDHDKIGYGHAQTNLLLDALESVFTDILAVYDSCGFAPQELWLQREVRKMRKTINKWFSGCDIHKSIYEETIRSAGDSVYDYTKQCQAEMFKEMEKIEEAQKESCQTEKQ